MLPKKNRLTSQRSFSEAKEKGKLLQNESFGLIYFERGDKEPTRFGIVVSTKVSKKAYLRNKAKRSLKNAVLKLLENVKEGYDVVFLVKKEGLNKIETIEKEVKTAFKKASLIK